MGFLGLLSPKTFVWLSLLLLFALIGTMSCSGFRLPDEDDLLPQLAAEPIGLESLPKQLGVRLSHDQLGQLKDRWGFLYGPAGPAEGLFAVDRHYKSNYNRGFSHLDRGDLKTALQTWSEVYSHYHLMVFCKNGGFHEPLPNRRDDLILYGSYRYHRGLMLATLAGNFAESEDTRLDYLKRALYDLRRATGTVEYLAFGKGRFEPYWGNRGDGWVDGSFLADHGGLSVLSVYGNLSTVYLRLGDEGCYPVLSPGYLRREAEKYQEGATPLGAITNRIVDTISKNGNRADTLAFRLALALQNLDMVGRGEKAGKDAQFNYTVGIILARLRDINRKYVTAEEVRRYLERAALQVATESDIGQAARKELFLHHLSEEDGVGAVSWLKDIDPQRIADLAEGPNKAYITAFADFLLILKTSEQYQSDLWPLVRGRGEAFAESVNDPQQIALYRSLSSAAIATIFDGIEDRMQVWLDHGRAGRVGGLLYTLDTDRHLDNMGNVKQYYRSQLRNKLWYRPGVGFNLLARHNPWLAWVYRLAPVFAALLLLSYWVFFYRAHRRQYQKRFSSGYRRDLRTPR